MKVGDYVRTEEGLIAKYIGINKEYKWHLFDGNIQWYYEYYRQEIDFEDWKEFIEEEVIKSSPNIIDLIEENDLLKIEYYSLRYNERVTRLFEVTFKDDEYINLSNAKCEFMLVNGEFNKGDKELKPIIKSIVTKEQFSEMEYKVGEK